LIPAGHERLAGEAAVLCRNFNLPNTPFLGAGASASPMFGIAKHCFKIKIFLWFFKRIVP
jgi:hypothetical protein